MKTIKGDLIMTKDMTFEEDLKVEGNIFGKDGKRYGINALNIKARDIDAHDIKARNIDALGINAWDINAWDINFYAVAVAHHSFKCKSWKARREDYVIKCIDGEIEIIK